MLHRAWSLANLVGRHASAQVATQGIAFVSGILIVRAMDKTDYAGYAICIAFISAIALVAEGGLNSSLMSFGGSIRANRGKFGVLYASVLRFRRVIGVPILVLGTSVVAALLVANNFNWWETLFASMLTAVSIWVSINSGTKYTVLRLDYNFQFIRIVNLLAAVGRLALVALVLFSGLGRIETMIALSLLVLLLTNRILDRKIHRNLPKLEPDMALYRPAFTKAAQRTMPMNMAMILAEQSILIILTFYGTTSSIAEIQAMSRFGVVFVVVNSLVIDLAAPYIARLAVGPSVWVRGLVPILGVYALACGLLVLCGAAFSDFLLGMLGSGYQGLSEYLVIVLCGLALTQFGHVFGVLNQARGWLRFSWTYIAFVPVWAIGGITFLDLTSTGGAALFMATQSLPLILTQLVRCTSGYRQDARRV